MVSRIIYDAEETVEAPESLESIEQRVLEVAGKKLTISLPGLEPSVKDIATETMEKLALYLVKKAQPDFIDNIIHSVDWHMGNILNEQFMKLEKKTNGDEQEALRVMGKAIRSVIDGVYEVTGVKTSVPHVGKSADLLEARRRAAEVSDPVSTGRSA